VVRGEAFTQQQRRRHREGARSEREHRQLGISQRWGDKQDGGLAPLDRGIPRAFRLDSKYFLFDPPES
jgi:hypothetical protein